jgi:hypothetical protein
MNTLDGILLVLVGAMSMGVGLLLFYTFLPLFYALFGLGAGYWLGGILTGAPAGEMSVIKTIFAMTGGALFATLAYLLEPYRRALIGIGLGALLGASVASALGLTGILGVVVVVLSAAIGTGITLAAFDIFIVIASATGGAGLVVDGAHLLLPSAAILDRTTIVADGALLPWILWIALAGIGMAWQFAHLQRWTPQGGEG